MQQIFYGEKKSFTDLSMFLDEWEIIYDPENLTELIGLTFFQTYRAVCCTNETHFNFLKNKFDGILFLVSENKIDNATYLDTEAILCYLSNNTFLQKTTNTKLYKFPMDIQQKLIKFAHTESVYSLVLKYDILQDLDHNIIETEVNPLFFIRGLEKSKYNSIIKNMSKTFEYKFLKHGSKHLVSYIKTLNYFLEENLYLV